MCNFIIQEMSFELYFFMSGFLFHFFMVSFFMVCVYSALANAHPHAHTYACTRNDYTLTF